MGCPPAPVYKGGRGQPRGGGTPKGGGAILLQVGLPLPFLVQEGGGGRSGRGERQGGRPPLPCPIRTRGEGARGLPWPALLFSLRAHVGPLPPPGGGPVTPRYSGKIPISPGTFPISKYRLPIYQSLCLDHFETPRLVRDHIRDSEQPSVHQNT